VAGQHIGGLPVADVGAGERKRLGVTEGRLRERSGTECDARQGAEQVRSSSTAMSHVQIF
jgi:hypothetical protein